MNLLKIKDLKDPFNDSTNYQSKSEKQFFQKIFLKTNDLDDLLKSSVYFLIGEKGSGKTAFAVYLENNNFNETRCALTTMTETQYNRFIKLKRQGKLAYSDYANIWRSMLLFMVGKIVVSKSKNILHLVTRKFSKLEVEINRWSKNALNPEVESAFEAVLSEVMDFKAKAKAEGVGEGEGGLSSTKTKKNNEVVLRHHLMNTENSFKEAISELKLKHDHILFIDGVDFRPENVQYQEYIECIKGLGEAVWQLNSGFFNGIKDSKGRIKIVLLVRPDVFHTLNLYNSNSRLQDNSVYLDWSTTEKEILGSRLFELSGVYFSAQQMNSIQPARAWDYYFSDVHQGAIELFKKLLKTSFQKPRDVLTFIKLARKHTLKCNSESDKFHSDIFNMSAMKRDYSDYLLGEVKNYAAFYMSQEDFSKYLKFFQYLDGKQKFDVAHFKKAFDNFKIWANGEQFQATSFLRDHEALLQLLYDVNIIGYSEYSRGAADSYYHWSYRERSLNNISPKVKSTGNLMLNPGIAKALDIGTEFKTNDAATIIRPAHENHRINRGRRKSR